MRGARERFREGVRSWSELLLPTRCLGCGGVGVGSGPNPVCLRCRTRLTPLPGPYCPRCQDPLGPEGASCRLCPTWPQSLRWCRSATRFQGPAAALVRALKYEGWERVVPALVPPLVRTLRSGDAPRVDRIIPVPTTPGRLKERGFNPARRIADGLGEALGIPVGEALVRPAEGPRQVGLPPSQRAANVRGAFIVEGAPPDPLQPPQVLLVDDVLTTGATVAAAAEALAQAGVAKVAVLTFARAAPGAPGS